MFNKIKKMYLFNLFILLACVYESQQRQKHNPDKFKSADHEKTNQRILELMRSYYEEATSRITYMNPMRFMYEESPYYEMGYIIAEIIERYRKVVEHAQKSVKFKFSVVFDLVKRIELVQKLYFELYHLVRMIHETPRKWSTEIEFRDIEKLAGPEILGGRGIDGSGTKYKRLTDGEMKAYFSLQQQLMDNQRARAKEKRRQKKKYDKLRQAFLLGMTSNMKPEKKAYNKFWPLDYGWEIDYRW